ncbi:MAG: cupin domain-containing protein [Aquimonas sp.]|nr:cupin domain-containing protein [Aquimonas sp.]
MSEARIHPQPPVEYWFVEGCHILEWHNRDDDPAVSIARARLAPGQTTRWHRLQGIVERYLLLSGRGRVEVEGLPPTEVEAGAVVVIPPGRAQRIHNSGGEDLVFLAVCTPRFSAKAYEDIESPVSD